MAWRVDAYVTPNDLTGREFRMRYIGSRRKVRGVRRSFEERAETARFISHIRIDGPRWTFRKGS